jgi:hypothetical protein
MKRREPFGVAPFAGVGFLALHDPLSEFRFRERSRRHIDA